MTTMNIVFLIDLQNGFICKDLSNAEGGALYVPDAEKTVEPAANLIRHLSNTIFILSQDFHPKDHISFASNHVGAAPFSNINLTQDNGGHFRVATHSEQGTLQQTLWLNHCIQGTKSCLFADDLMDELPPNLAHQLQQHSSNPILTDIDFRRNAFYVVRKGMRSDLDSYGIATENDGVSTTYAPELFKALAQELETRGVDKVSIYVGGLATNFCVEFSHNDIYKYFVPTLTAHHITSNVSFLTDLSRGIPIDAPKGAWPDLNASLQRMKVFGTTPSTTDDIIRASLARPTPQKNNFKYVA